MNSRGPFFEPKADPIVIDRVRVVYIDGQEDIYSCKGQEAAERLASVLSQDKTVTVTLLDQNGKSYRYGLVIKLSLSPMNEHGLVLESPLAKVLPVLKNYFNLTVAGKKAIFPRSE